MKDKDKEIAFLVGQLKELKEEKEAAINALEFTRINVWKGC